MNRPSLESCPHNVLRIGRVSVAVCGLVYLNHTRIAEHSAGQRQVGLEQVERSVDRIFGNGTHIMYGLLSVMLDLPVVCQHHDYRPIVCI